MFQDILRDLVERTEGGRAGVLMGFDGLPVDAYYAAPSHSQSGAENPRTDDLEPIGMEFGVILRDIARAAETLNLGEVREVSVATAEQLLVLRVVNRDYFVALVLDAWGNQGKARFLLRTGLPKIAAELF